MAMNVVHKTGNAPATLVERVYFTVPAHYSEGEPLDSWTEAVLRARAAIECIEYPAQRLDTAADAYHPRRCFQEGNTLVVYTRQFVHMRVTEPVQDRGDKTRSGSDHVVATWEVFHDGTVEEVHDTGTGNCPGAGTPSPDPASSYSDEPAWRGRNAAQVSAQAAGTLQSRVPRAFARTVVLSGAGTAFGVAALATGSRILTGATWIFLVAILVNIVAEDRPKPTARRPRRSLAQALNSLAGHLHAGNDGQPSAENAPVDGEGSDLD